MDTTNIMPNIPKLGERDVISEAHDDGSSVVPSIPLTGNGSGIHAAVPPPNLSKLPYPEPHFAHVGPSPILDKDDYSH
jgi:hypothetical protein